MSWWHAAVGIVLAALALVAVHRKPGTPEPNAPVERERRANAVLAGPAGGYGLGCGGRDPRAVDPWGPRSGHAGRRWCDCSGAIAWVLGIPRKIAGYARGFGWFSTDGIIRDADDPAVELVQWVRPAQEVVAWRDLLVYGSVDTDGDGDRDAIGHVGIVAAVPDGWRYTGPASLEALTVWHCASNWSATGAVRLSSGRPWRVRGRVVRVV